MTYLFTYLSKVKRSLDNGPRMDRLWPDFGPMISRKLFAIFFCLLFVGVGSAWGATGDEIKAIGSITSGKAYYIKGVRTNGTVEYLSFTDAEGETVSGTSATTTGDAQPLTFTYESSNWYITTGSGLYLTPAASNGKLILTKTKTSVTLSNGTNTIKIQGASYYLQKNKTAANFGGYNDTQNDVTLIEAAPISTVTFYNAYGVGSPAPVTQAAIGASVTIPSVSPSENCALLGWVFAGWKEGSYQTSDVTSLSGLVRPGSYVPAGDKSFYAVFKRTVGANGAAVGDDILVEDFSGFAKDNVPTTSNSSTTVYGGGSVTYTCTNGGSNTKIFEESLAGGASPEILVGKSGGSFAISGIPSGNATTLTLSYRRNKPITPSVSGTGYSIGAESGSNPYTSTITVGSASTFTLTFSVAGSDNVRVDDISIVVATTSNGGTTTYNSNPGCVLDRFIDVMHDNVIDVQTGTYSMPAALSDASKGDDTYCDEKHYHFLGWVKESDLNENGTMKAGATLYPAGDAGHTAANKTYYAVWGKDE